MGKVLNVRPTSDAKWYIENALKNEGGLCGIIDRKRFVGKKETLVLGRYP